MALTVSSGDISEEENYIEVAMEPKFQRPQPNLES